MAKVYKPASRNNLYVRYKLGTEWKSASTPFVPGQEAEALAHGERLETRGANPETPETVYEWAEKWLKGRGKSHDNDESILRIHVLPGIGKLRLEEVRPLHIVGIVEKLQASGKAPKTVHNVYAVIKAMWRDARILDLVDTDPCILTVRQLGKLKDKDLGWRATAVFTREEAAALIMDERIPFHRRVMWSLLILGMLRDGEMCGLRWERVDLTMKPLGRITVAMSYDEDTTKTETERWMPIHPILNTLLFLWKTQEWAKEHGRPPEPHDLVMPAPKPQNRGRRKAQGSMLDHNYVWKRMFRDLKTLGFRHRRVHDTRRTGISIAVEDGADEDILKRGTHAPPKDIMSLYTTVQWEKLCAEVVKLKLRNPDTKTYDPQRSAPVRVTRRTAPRISRRTK